MTEVDRESYDVGIIGAGAAGLSAALMLGRARRSVLVVDDGKPRNAPAAHAHAFLTRDGTPPERLRELGRQEVAGYGVEFRDGRALSAVRTPDGFLLGLDSGQVCVRRLLLATGVVDELPDVPGLAERWGRDVLHCPYCHGWEVRDQPIGVLSTGPLGMHQAQLFRQWTSDLTLFRHTGPALSEEEAEQLAARGVRVMEGEVVGLEISEDQLAGVRLRSGEVVPVRALAVAPRARVRGELPVSLGLEPTVHPAGIGEHIATGKAGATAVDGVWAAGNIADPPANVVVSAAAGAAVGSAINADLIAEDTRLAVRAHRAPFSAESEARLCEQAAGSRRHGFG
ncbi:NAD(P)/FAD-dependent oxidoreductase [Saccharopolyspora taberi]|uniref:NAD(P)/FAD-dependent oxidoreductase n=1 Tax=Saccharopolyspora taberi TaxID=60895 RepID=A0ABN3V1V2_9PSEU